MSLATEAITALDEHLSEAGTPIILRRYLTRTPTVTKTDTTVNAAVRITKGDDLQGRVDFYDARAIVSPTGLPDEPKRDDKVVFNGIEYNVELVKPFLITGLPVRYELMLSGV